MHVIKPINIATELCRSRNDFDDGFVYAGDASSPAVANSGSAPLVSKSSRRVSVASEHSSKDQSAKPRGSLLPYSVLWKAGLAVETVYHVLLQSSRVKPFAEQAKGLSQVLDRPTIVVLADSLSEFTTVGAGCQSHILQLIDVCSKRSHQNNHDNDNLANSNSNNPNDIFLRTMSRDDNDQTMPTTIDAMLFIRAEQLVKSGAVSVLFDDAEADMTTGDKKQSSASSSSLNSMQDVLVMGETLWIAFHVILRVAVSVLSNAPPELVESLSDGLFAPSLETLQHIMKRCPGSRDLTRLSLNGYSHLANICMPSTTPGRVFKRKALLSSLCKMCLPSWGKRDAMR
jgi:hypothetical protein